MRSYFRISSAGRAHTWLLAFAVTRSVLDDFWVPAYTSLYAWVLSFINTLVYIYALYLLIPLVQKLLVEKIFRGTVDIRSVLRSSLLLWAVYPAVTAISLAAKSPPNQTIAWFRLIPTFMVEKNFFPVGMIVVVPVLAVAYTYLLTRYSDVGWLRSYLAVLASLVAIYLVYYQYTLRLLYIVNDKFGVVVGFGFYTLCFLVPLWPAVGRFRDAFGQGSVDLARLVPVSVMVCAAIVAIGLFANVEPLRGARAPTALSVATADGSSGRAGRIAYTLRSFELFDETNTLVASGFLTATRKGQATNFQWNDAGVLSKFQLYYAGQVLQDHALVTYSAQQITYGNILDLHIVPGDESLVFRWNKAGAAGDPFLESYRGTDALASCNAILTGVSRKCYMLDEQLTGDFSLFKLWTGETFMAIQAHNFGAIALQYDSYVDGLISVGGENRRVIRVSRLGTVVDVTFVGGTLAADCRPLASYKTLPALIGGPSQSPVRCAVDLEYDDTRLPKFDAFGLIEWIGEKQQG